MSRKIEYRGTTVFLSYIYLEDEDGRTDKRIYVGMYTDNNKADMTLPLGRPFNVMKLIREYNKTLRELNRSW